MNLKPIYQTKLSDESGQHRYLIGDDSTYYPGVTTILDVINKPLVQWAAKVTADYTNSILKKIRFMEGSVAYKMDDKFLETLYKRSKKQHKFIKNKTAEIGRTAHEIFDGKEIESSKKEISCLRKSWDMFIEREKPGMLLKDTIVGSRIYGYGGRLDSVISFGHRPYLADYKTGKSIYETHGYQIAAYAQAFKEQMGNDELLPGVVIRFSQEKPGYEIKFIRSIPDCLSAFLSALDLYRKMKIEVFNSVRRSKK